MVFGFGKSRNDIFNDVINWISKIQFQKGQLAQDEKQYEQKRQIILYCNRITEENLKPSEMDKTQLKKLSKELENLHSAIYKTWNYDHKKNPGDLLQMLVKFNNYYLDENKQETIKFTNSRAA